MRRLGLGTPSNRDFGSDYGSLADSRSCARQDPGLVFGDTSLWVTRRCLSCKLFDAPNERLHLAGRTSSTEWVA